MVAAIAFESVVKLLAFLAVGVFVTSGCTTASATCSRAPLPRAILPSCSPSMWTPVTRAGSRSPLLADAGDHLPAAPVPGARGRERRRAAPQEGRLAVPALPAADQPLRAADRLRRPAALSARQRGRRHVRADAADGRAPASARAARLHRRAVGRDRHGDRRDDRALHDGVQRPRDAGAAALRPPASAERRRSDRRAAGDPARRHRGDPAARLRVLPARRRGLRAGLHRPHLLRGGRAVRAGDPRRHLLEGRHARRRARRADRRLRGLDLHAAAAVVRQLGLARRKLPSRTARSASRCCAPTSCSASPGSTRSRTRCSGACSSTSALYVAVSLVDLADRRSSAARPRCSSTSSGTGGARRRAILARSAPRSETLRRLLARFLGEPRARSRVPSPRTRAQPPPRRRQPGRRRSRVHFVERQLAGAIGAARRASWSPRWCARRCTTSTR